MELISPGLGLVFWMVISFSIVVYVLGKFAWKPILKSIKDRELSIENALQAAEKAKEEMKALIFNNEKLKKEALEERDALLSEARKIKDNIIEEAKLKAKEEYNRIIENAKESIAYEKIAAMTELKNQVAILSINIAEKVLEKELSEGSKQQDFLNKLLDEVKFN